MIYSNGYSYCFTVCPWFKNVTRSLIKEPKIYLWDLSQVQDEGAGIENFLASHLFKFVNFYSDTGFGRFKLFYLRDLDKREVENFVINEIIKLYWNKGKRKQVYFLRDSRGHEIDCVLPFNYPSEIYYEIKSGETFSPDFVKNIDYYKDYGKGAVIYRGDNSFTFKDTRIIKLEEFLSSMWDIYNQNELSEIEKRFLEEIRTNNSEKVEEEVARRERQREREEIINWLDGNLARMTEKAEAHDRLMNWSVNVGKPAFDKIWTDLGKDEVPSSERICKVLNDSIVPSLNAANGGSTFRAKYADYKNGIIGLTDDNGHDVLYSVFENNPNLKKNHVMTESANAVQETAVSESRKPI